MVLALVGLALVVLAPGVVATVVQALVVLVPVVLALVGEYFVFWTWLGAVENEECGGWKMWSVENEECGKYGVWKMRSVENTECGKCGVWKVRSVESAEHFNFNMKLTNNLIPLYSH